MSDKNPIKFLVPKDLTPHLVDTLSQMYFDPPEVVATDEDATSGKATQEVYTESAATNASGAATASPDDASFVYLDVGLWAGSNKWPKARDFGLIHGPVVLLCTFSTQNSEPLPDHEKLDKDQWNADAGGPTKGDTDFEASALAYGNNLLELITQLSKSPKLGKVYVRQQMIAKTKPPAVTTLDGKTPIEPIYVIVGDMHIPLADKVEPDPGPGGKVPRWGRIDMKPLKVVIDDLIPPGATDPLSRVTAIFKWIEDTEMDPTVQLAIKKDWWGLVAHVAPELIIDQAMPGAAAIRAAIGIGDSPVTAGFKEFVDVAKKVWEVRDDRGVVDDTMSYDDAKDWFEYYRVGKDEKAPADISENAVYDFHEFVTLLDQSNQKSRIQFMQLGDMLDFWIGFSSYFTPSDNPYMPVEPDTEIQIVTKDQLKKKIWAYLDEATYVAENTGKDALLGPLGSWLVDKVWDKPNPPPDPSTVPATETLPPRRCTDNLQHWMKNLFTNTDHGKTLAKALDILNRMPLEPIFLYGNHDNYLGSHVVGKALANALPNSGTPLPGAKGERRAPFPQRQPKYLSDGLYMEHGHQCDSSNGNDVALIPVQFLIGTDSTPGVFLTQAAFIKPKDIRTFEGTASAAKARIAKNAGKDPGFGDRFDQIAYAIKLHDTTTPFRVYCMGHTHSPVLLDVTIANKPRTGAQSLTNKLFSGRADVQVQPPLKYSASSDQYENVTVLYKNFPADAAGHINLEDPWGPQRKPISSYPRNDINKVVPLRFPVNGANGSGTAYAVPPGAYVARYYPGDGDEVFVWQSTPFMFQGLSFDTKQSMFAPGQNIPLRWALSGTYPPEVRIPAHRLIIEVFAHFAKMTTEKTDGDNSTFSTVPDASVFVGQQWAVEDATSTIDYAHGRTLLSGLVVARIKETCARILDNFGQGLVETTVEPGGKALAPDFYIYLIGLPVDRPFDPASTKPCVPPDEFDSFRTPSGLPKYLGRLWLRMRIPIPPELQVPQ